jgi:hypothetical protein
MSPSKGVGCCQRAPTIPCAALPPLGGHDAHRAAGSQTAQSEYLDRSAAPITACTSNWNRASDPVRRCRRNEGPRADADAADQPPIDKRVRRAQHCTREARPHPRAARDRGTRNTPAPPQPDAPAGTPRRSSSFPATMKPQLSDPRSTAARMIGPWKHGTAQGYH